LFTMTMKKRALNFNPGPAHLPVEVLNALGDSIFIYQNSCMGVLELSHRSLHFTEILKTLKKDLRKLLSIPDQYSILFTTGGATNQFSMVPMNLLSEGQTADYILSGSWAEKAYEEAQKFGNVQIAASSKDRNFSYIPTEVKNSSDSAYLHFTSNNTLYGTQFKTEPETGAVLVCDASSDILSRKIDVAKYGLIYAGAQKNLGPAGVTLVIIRKDLLKRSSEKLPVMMNYNTYANSSSLYNTPPVFAIYVVGEVLKWIKREGGLAVIEKRNEDKAKILYDMIDSTDFYLGTAEKSSRSIMNVTFRLPNEELEKKFLQEAEANHFVGLPGHRSVGGVRASIYNAFPVEGVEKLVEFMKRFKKSV